MLRSSSLSGMLPAATATPPGENLSVSLALDSHCTFRRDVLSLVSRGFDSTPGAHLPQVLGRSFPVEILYAKDPCLDYLESCVTTVMQVAIMHAPVLKLLRSCCAGPRQPLAPPRSCHHVDALL